MKTFELFESKQVLAERKLFTTAMSMCESMIKMLEARAQFDIDKSDDIPGQIDFEPQPEFRGKTGTSTDSGYGIELRKAGQQRELSGKFASQWNNLKKAYMKIRGRDVHGAKKMYQQLQKLSQLAAKKGISDLEMPPAPNEEQSAAY